MFGYTHPDKFSESIKASLKIPDEKVKILSNAINERILKGIREQLMSLQNTKKYKEIEIETPIKPEILPDLKKENEVLKSAGIEVVEEDNKTAEIPQKTNPGISAQKLAEPFKMAKTQTEYSLGNITKQDSGVSIKTEPKTAVPYRLDPTE